jgi:glycosyltransferase involved in cell wall biosynthesis
MKKVLHLLSSNKYSGAENVAINIIKNLRHKYNFLYVSPDGPIKERLEFNNIEYLEYNNLINFYLILNKWKPDIIHAHDFRASIKTAFLPINTFKISHLHQNPIWIKNININTFLFSLSISKLDKIITVSPEILDEAIFSKKMDKKTNILNNFVDSNNIIEKSSIGKECKKFDLGFMGRFTKAKNPLKFINIIKELVKYNKDLSAVMIGDGDLKEVCEQKIIDLNLSNNIKLTGFLNNPFPILNNVKIIIITSKWEGFGLAAVEAMILGKPVIATPVGGLKSIITEEAGRLCKKNDQFVKEIIKILNSRELYNKLSQGAKESSKRFTNRNKWKEEIENIYENIL